VKVRKTKRGGKNPDPSLGGKKKDEGHFTNYNHGGGLPIDLKFHLERARFPLPRKGQAANRRYEKKVIG